VRVAHPFVSGWFVISLWCVYKLLVTVPWVTFAFVFDAGPLRVWKYESVVIGLGTRAEVVSGEQKASLLELAAEFEVHCNVKFPMNAEGPVNWYLSVKYDRDPITKAVSARK